MLSGLVERPGSTNKRVRHPLFFLFNSCSKGLEIYVSSVLYEDGIHGSKT